MNKEQSTITITFGDQGENHAGMEKIGKMVPAGSGFSLADLTRAKNFLEENGVVCELVDLNMYLPGTIDTEKAYILIARNATEFLIEEESDKLFDELSALDVDKKAKMRGAVKNKIARWNLCFAQEMEQEPDYENGKGRIVPFSSTPLLDKFRNKIESVIGEKGKDLMAEGNYYYNSDKCGIGYHGDAERRKVIAVRLGKSMSLCYHWYLRSERVGEKAEFILNHGDVYFMSEKATGCDWKRISIYTLRHSAGCKKYTE